jgi:hypothetical protein
MTDQDASVVIALAPVVDALREREAQHISGSLLRKLVTEMAPQIDPRAVMNRPTGSGAFSEFVSTYLAEHLVQDGRVGLDRNYRITTPGRPAPPIPPEAEPLMWLAFASSTAPVRLVLRMPGWVPLVVAGENATAEDISSRLGEVHLQESRDDDIVVASMTREELDAITLDFTTLLSSEASQSLIDALKAAGGYLAWTNTLRSFDPQSYRRWISFRLERINDAFRGRLKALDVPDDHALRLASQLRASQLTRTHRRNDRGPQAQPVHSVALKPAASKANSDEVPTEVLRKVVLLVAEQLGPEDLKLIRLPVGAVLEAFLRNRAK